MRNLCIDIGNTSAKLAIFEEKDMLHYSRVDEITAQELISIIRTFGVDQSIISTVNRQIDDLEVVLKASTVYRRFSVLPNRSIKNSYKTPDSLGLDRWAAILGADAWFPGQACFIIDAGTCITYDLLTAERIFHGGSISPGINMRFKAVHNFTGRLPLVNWDIDEIPEGKDTITAIQSGVLQGTLHEIEGFIAQNNIKNKPLKVIITGGDADFLVNRLQNSIFAPQIIKDSFLVLKGLNEAISD